MQGEQVIVNGTGVQQDAAGRWGGAGSMTLDPLDDCRFWHTLQYVASSGHFTWRTRIASMRFANCENRPALPVQQATALVR
jgi:Golgi nucleoside diphosphatase